MWAGTVGSDKRLAIQPVDTGTIFVPERRGSARGHLFFGRGRGLVALPFEVARLSATGRERFVAEGLVSRAAVGSALQLMDFSAAADTVVYRVAGRMETMVVRNRITGKA